MKEEESKPQDNPNPSTNQGEGESSSAAMNRIRIRRRQITTCVFLLLLSTLTSTFAQFGLSKGTPMSVPDAGEGENGGGQDGFLSEEVGFRFDFVGSAVI